MLAVSALLGYAAGFSGLTNLVGKTWVGLIALAAGLSTAAVILLLTTLKPNDHLRAGAAYQDIYLRTVQQGLNDDNLWRLQDEFRKTAADTNKDGIGLSLSAIRKFREAARSELRQEPELPALDDRSAIDRATLPEERS
jgi:hypothetical protein